MPRTIVNLLLTTIAIACVAPEWRLAAASQPAASSRTVLALHWGPEDFPGNPDGDAAIREALMVPPAELPVRYYAEYLETEEFPSETVLPAFRDYLRDKFAGRRIDVVIADSTPALQFALRYREELFAGVPLVFVAGSIPGLTVNVAHPGVTGILSDAQFAGTLELALKLHPSARRVYVVAQAPTSEGYDERVRTALQRFSQRVELTYIKERTVAGLLTAVKAIADGLIFYTRYAPEESDSIVYPDAVARQMAQVASVPIYTSADVLFGTGVVGGLLTGRRTTGTQLGKLARQILDGARPDDIPVGTVQVTPMFDWRQVERWGIDPARLPPGSEIFFRTPTVWEAYRSYVVGALTLLLLQTALITALLIQRRYRRRAEQDLRQSEAALRTSYERNRDLAARLLQATETEHARIARELHDDICQRLLLLTMELEAVNRAKPDSATAALKAANDIATSLHDLSHRLHPTRLRLIGLIGALDRLCIEVSRSAIAVSFTHDNVPASPSPELMLCLFRVVQETLQNALKHSNARHVSVNLTGSADGLTLTILDDGVGFDVDAAWHKGVGLLSMVERLEAMGGTLQISSSAGAGTRLTAVVPR